MLESRTIRKQIELRNKLIDIKSKKIMVARISDSIEADDEYTHVNCNGYGRIRKYSTFRLHFSRAATARHPTRSNSLRHDQYDTQVFQVAGCDFRCWYCFVDDKLLSADSSHARWFSAGELLDMALHDSAPTVIDLSGGQAELVPEWTVWMMEEIEQRGLKEKITVWSDDNLSCNFFWTHLNHEQRQYVINFPGYCKTVCLKGFDSKGFAANTGTPGIFFERQLEILKRLWNDGVNMDIYLTMLDIPRQHQEAEVIIDQLLQKLISIHPTLPHRIVPLKIYPFSNMLRRANVKRLENLGLQINRFNLWTERLKKIAN